MRKSFIINIFIIFCASFLSALSEANNSRIIENYGKIPLSFTINKGHYDQQVKFTTRGSGCTMFFTQEMATLLLPCEEV